MTKALCELVPVVGLEIHVQLAARCKLFDRTKSVLDLKSGVNEQVSFFDAALPGTMPRVSQSCVELALRACGGFHFSINPRSRFDRKHYFYFDLPSGYQITQYSSPLGKDGRIRYHVQSSKVEAYVKETRFTRLQLEQDSGKSIHGVLEGKDRSGLIFKRKGGQKSPSRSEPEGKSLVDLNRANMGLIELVTEPNLSNGLEAASLVQEFQMEAVELGITKGRMENGDIRVDANVSLSNVHTGEDFPRVEIKNISGIRFLKRAIDLEVERQMGLSEAELRALANETMYFDLKNNQNRPMRSKEFFHDYRYMPEPNLAPLHLTSDVIEKFSNTASVSADFYVTPFERIQSWVNAGVNHNLAVTIMMDEDLRSLLIEFLNQFSSQGPQICSVFVDILWNAYRNVCSELRVDLAEGWNLDLFVEITRLASEKRITSEVLKVLLTRMVKQTLPFPVDRFVEDSNWMRITDPSEIMAACENAIKAKDVVAAKYKNSTGTGRKSKKLMDQLVSHVLNTSNLRIDSVECKEILHSLIKGESGLSK